MKLPKANKGDKVRVLILGEEFETTVLNVYPMQFGHDNRPIVKPVQLIEYSYQFEIAKATRFPESVIVADSVALSLSGQQTPSAPVVSPPNGQDIPEAPVVLPLSGQQNPELPKRKAKRS